MQVALTPLMQERWAADGIAVHAMHPGWADTPGVVTSLPGFHRLMGPLLRDPETGADTIVWLRRRPSPPPRAGGSGTTARRGPRTGSAPTGRPTRSCWPCGATCSTPPVSRAEG